MRRGAESRCLRLNWDITLGPVAMDILSPRGDTRKERERHLNHLIPLVGSRIPTRG
jgi:hypothetical protein